MGEYEQALEAADRRVDVARRSEDLDPTEEAQAISSRGWLLSQMGEVEEGSRAVEGAIALLKEMGADEDQLASHQNNLAVIRQGQGRHGEAHELLGAILKATSPGGAHSRRERATQRGNLAVSASELGKHVEAVRAARQSLSEMEELFESPHPDIAATKDKLGSSLIAAGRADEGLAMRTEAMDELIAVFGPDYPDSTHAMISCRSSHEAIRKSCGGHSPL